MLLLKACGTQQNSFKRQSRRSTFWLIYQFSLISQHYLSFWLTSPMVPEYAVGIVIFLSAFFITLFPSPHRHLHIHILPVIQGPNFLTSLISLLVLVFYCDNLSGLNQHWFSLLKFCRSKVKNQFHRANIKVSEGLVPSGGSEGESINLPFSASSGHLYSLACGLFLYLQSASLQSVLVAVKWPSLSPTVKSLYTSRI